MTTEGAALADAPRLPETSTANWFTNITETVPVNVGSVAFQIARDLPARAAFSATQGLEADRLGWEEYSLRKAAWYVKGSSLKTPLPQAHDELIASLRKMRRSRFQSLYERIVEHDNSLERRQHKGEWFNTTQWAEKVKADKALPKWDDLLAYIEPQVSISADAWFEPEDETFTLALPDGHWMRVKCELTQGEFVSLVAPPAVKDDEPEPLVPAGWVGARRLAAYIKDWSLSMPMGKAPVDITTLAEVDASKFAVMHKTLEAFEQIVKKEREANPTGAGS